MRTTGHWLGAGVEERFRSQPLYRDAKGYIWQRLRNGKWGSTDRLSGDAADMPPPAHGPYQKFCCLMHNSHCEPPAELCCADCSEWNHPQHPPGVACTWQ